MTGLDVISRPQPSPRALSAPLPRSPRTSLPHALPARSPRARTSPRARGATPHRSSHEQGVDSCLLGFLGAAAPLHHPHAGRPGAGAAWMGRRGQRTQARRAARRARRRARACLVRWRTACAHCKLNMRAAARLTPPKPASHCPPPGLPPEQLLQRPASSACPGRRRARCGASTCDYCVIVPQCLCFAAAMRQSVHAHACRSGTAQSAALVQAAGVHGAALSPGVCSQLLRVQRSACTLRQSEALGGASFVRLPATTAQLNHTCL